MPGELRTWPILAAALTAGKQAERGQFGGWFSWFSMVFLGFSMGFLGVFLGFCWFFVGFYLVKFICFLKPLVLP